MAQRFQAGNHKIQGGWMPMMRPRHRGASVRVADFSDHRAKAAFGASLCAGVGRGIFRLATLRFRLNNTGPLFRGPWVWNAGS